MTTFSGSASVLVRSEGATGIGPALFPVETEGATGTSSPPPWDVEEPEGKALKAEVVGIEEDMMKKSGFS
jgi:hypothetical protein